MVYRLVQCGGTAGKTGRRGAASGAGPHASCQGLPGVQMNAAPGRSPWRCPSVDAKTEGLLSHRGPFGGGWRCFVVVYLVGAVLIKRLVFKGRCPFRIKFLLKKGHWTVWARQRGPSLRAHPTNHTQPTTPSTTTSQHPTNGTAEGKKETVKTHKCTRAAEGGLEWE